jgi:tetratricopeptide (TPR) repeat protein
VSNTEPKQRASRRTREPLAVVEEIREALEAGRVPRGRRPLQEAARQLRAAGRNRDAAVAHRSLALLELRHGDAAAARTRVRSALRLARMAGEPEEIDACLDLLTRVYSRLGEHEEAGRCAAEGVRDARVAGDPGRLAAALRRMAVVAWAAGDRPAAFRLTEEALSEARRHDGGALASEMDRLFASFLLEAGCPSSARDQLTRTLRGCKEPGQVVRALVARGWSSLRLGQPDSAARDFRKAGREARRAGDYRSEVEATISLAVAEALQARDAEDAAPRERARKTAGRALRLARRLKDARLEQGVRSLHERVERGAVGPVVVEPKEAARALVALARSTDSLRVADACLREVERIAASGGDLSYEYAPPPSAELE